MINDQDLKTVSELVEPMNYKVRDINLANDGRLRIDWAEAHMPVLMALRERYVKEKPLKGFRVAGCLHITKETAALVRTLRAAGAETAWSGCNPLSTQDDVAAALAEEGVSVFGWKGLSTDEYYWCIEQVLELQPNITLDDGADLVTTLHEKHRELIRHVKGGTEETTTGVTRLRAMAKEGVLRYPIIAVNDAQSKNLFDNPIGTGQSALDGIMRATSVLFAGKDVVVVGYGQVGSGIAERARGMGARVTIVEAQPVRALRAAMFGFRVASMRSAAEYGDIFVTATGDINVIRGEHFGMMKDGALLANAGHFDVEVSKKDLEQMSTSKRRINPCTEEYTLKNGRKLYLLAEGRLVNLACAEGHPSEIMDLSFSIQAASIVYIAKNAGRLPVDVIRVPDEIDSSIASLKLETMGFETEKLTEEQMKYLTGWQIGT